MDGIVYILRTGCQWKMLLNMVQDQPVIGISAVGSDWHFQKDMDSVVKTYDTKRNQMDVAII